MDPRLLARTQQFLGDQYRVENVFVGIAKRRQGVQPLLIVPAILIASLVGAAVGGGLLAAALLGALVSTALSLITNARHVFATFAVCAGGQVVAIRNRGSSSRRPHQVIATVDRSSVVFHPGGDAEVEVAGVRYSVVGEHEDNARRLAQERY